jgi:hypothetical protein
MRVKFPMPKLAWLVLSSLLPLSAACLTGCDSSSSEAQKSTVAAQQKQIQEEEDRANKALQKTSGKNEPGIKSIKSRIGQGAQGSQ